MKSAKPFPPLTPEAGLDALKGMARERSIMAGLTAMHAHMGDAFQIALPGFQPAVFVGPENNKRILVSEREKFLWRTESDPVTKLLRHGLLVEDHAEHLALRNIMEPAMHRGPATQHIPAMWHETDFIIQQWQDGGTQDMLIEMRKIALLILFNTLFGIDFRKDLTKLWQPILKSIGYISPGIWIILKDAPRIGYSKQIQNLDDYLYKMIRARRASPVGDNLLSRLVQAGLDDDLIRDQLLTILIAGHDTSTALLAWALYLLGKHPTALTRATQEARTILGNTPPTADEINQLHYLELVIKETLRLYPPIHVGNRRAADNLEMGGYQVEKDSRVMYSIYLSHRDPKHWQDPERFHPERFERPQPAPPHPLTYIPFGGGPRNCIGTGFARVEAKLVLARILQSCDLTLLDKKVHTHMGATLEPRPGVLMKINRSSTSTNR